MLIFRTFYQNTSSRSDSSGNTSRIYILGAQRVLVLAQFDVSENRCEQVGVAIRHISPTRI